MAMGNPNRLAPSEHPIPTKIGSKMGVHLPPNGTTGFDPQPNTWSLLLTFQKWLVPKISRGHDPVFDSCHGDSGDGSPTRENENVLSGRFALNN